MTAVLIRDATGADLPKIVAILNQAIAETTALWTDEPETLESRRAWLDARRMAGSSVIVAERHGEVVGFGSVAPFRSQAGFRHTVEHSLYVDPAAKRGGIGRALLTALEGQARASRMHAMVGAIAADNEASLALHRAAGFLETGRMPEVGIKFGRRLDLVLVQKRL